MTILDDKDFKNMRDQWESVRGNYQNLSVFKKFRNCVSFLDFANNS